MTNYREVNRIANVGERIRIVNPQFAYGYGEGAEGAVLQVDGSGVYADINGNRPGVFHREYVVLEPVATLGSDEALADAFTQFIRDNADTIRTILGDSASNVTKTEPAELTRAAVIEKARADVAELERIGRDVDSRLPELSPFHSNFYRVKFYVNCEKRAVTACITYRGGSAVRARGIAKAAPDDVFHAEIGKAIALRRALGLMVPSEYTDAPKPDEPRVGAIVIDRYFTNTWETTLTSRIQQYDASGHGKAWRHTHDLGWIGEDQFAIIDDTDVDYSVVTEGAAA
ncbi:hypothetical protein ABH892_004464 [Paenibacillus sp. RC254]|uniref:hypothetical protein n=1 Tax=unclassified Paenibacillus TaxID=185978 RepID=UPI0024B9BF23|nr:MULTISPECIES: hypothetical protein [unclassified Paenibacillus]